LVGREVVCFHPHESHFNVPLPEVHPIPIGMAMEDAVFFPGVETALSLAMDAAPIVGENVAVLGQGIVGLLTTSILEKMPLGHLVAADRYALRQERSLRMGAEVCLDPSRGPRQFLEDAGLARSKVDAVIELSGTPEGLEFATCIAALEGRIIVGSWYGTSPQGCRLGDEFHRQRLRIISSQVSRISGDLSSRWSKERRAELTWKTIRQISPSQLITHRFPITEASEAYRSLDENGHLALQVLLTYPEA
jgi:threonine dehydrogenase-like Zn-dependent dehydrogenase